MLVVISPAKRLDFESRRELPATDPEWQDQAVSLARTARRLSQKKLMELMGISKDLAKLNADRFRDFAEEPSLEITKQAALAFAGDTYLGLEAGSLSDDDLAYAQDHLRILSGLYGLLRPLDRIQPYRLEMGSRLATRRGKTLYDFWDARISEGLNAAARAAGTEVLVNCASVEYFSAVAPEALKLRVITPTFLEEKGGEAKVVSFFAKKARGAMARYIVERRLTDPAALSEFDTGGYCYQPERSTPDAPVFLRSAADSEAA